MKYFDVFSLEILQCQRPYKLWNLICSKGDLWTISGVAKIKQRFTNKFIGHLLKNLTNENCRDII